MDSVLADFKNIHPGETLLVCGCGSSLHDLKNPQDFITIGVNDVGRLFTPTYLTVLNPPQQFKGNRFQYVQNSTAQAIFTQLDLKLNHSRIVRFKLGKRGGADFSDPNELPYTQNSPYVALCLAAYMGAKKIGLIGVDFTDHHFFAKTGRHPLQQQLTRIDREYTLLGQALEKHGIEVVNLSQQSRLTAFRKADFTELSGSARKSMKSAGEMAHQEISSTIGHNNTSPRLFFVNYKFLSCGDVFRSGLKNAAADLHIPVAEAYWDDPLLPQKVQRFQPDVLFVVHGRRFAHRWNGQFRNEHRAIWLLDEPYEVDDTAKFSRQFDTVFVNDQNTIFRHQNAHYLPVGFDPHIYLDAQHERVYDVGFIGGYNAIRERLLDQLAQQKLLSYVVGGPWKSHALRSICLSPNIPAAETAALYQKTKIVINIFREKHHFNRQNIPAYSMNPRIYEALACGALVISEVRPEIKELFPDLPVFENGEQLVSILKDLLNDNQLYTQIQQACFRRISDHTFSNRLNRILAICLGAPMKKQKPEKASSNENQITIKNSLLDAMYKQWIPHGNICQVNGDGSLLLKKSYDSTAGSEEGLASQKQFDNLTLSFEIKAKEESLFIAKIHQEDKFNQKTNSYHLVVNGFSSYFARHNHIYHKIDVPDEVWQKIRMIFCDGKISVLMNDKMMCHISDTLLPKGYSFLGIKGGEVYLKNIKMRNDSRVPRVKNHDNNDYIIRSDFTTSFAPDVSIITTVYDRVLCLQNCIKSVKRLNYKNYEHIIVADAPSSQVLDDIQLLIGREDNSRIQFVTMRTRHNNWGIAPASVGLKLARGKYICFLSDDNGYIPDHFAPLVEMLERNDDLDFVYSSCRYAGIRVLRSGTPRPGCIDLGQPLFRRKLFGMHLPQGLSFDMMAWDWHMIELFLKQGARWEHIDRPTFLFKLEKYPQFIPQ